MLSLCQSNRFETLADRLIDALRLPVGQPLAAAVVVTPDAVTADWLATRAARRLGVCSGVEFTTPAEFVRDVYQRLLPGVVIGADEPAQLGWRLLALFARLPTEARFAPLLTYLGQMDAAGQYELARQLADVYTRYQQYRPDWLARWAAGADDHWQAALWRQLRAAEPESGAALHAQALAALTPAAAQRLPARIMLIGLPTLPPPWRELYVRLGELCEVQVYLLAPEPADHPHRHSLLTSLDALGRAERERWQPPLPPLASVWVEPGTDSLLAALHSDLLHGQERGLSAPPLTIAARDRSLQVHACHSPLRELEVLYDQLLALFERYPALRPNDIVVLTPDIDRYAPTIEAVFAAAEADRHIPYRIAGQRARSLGPLLETFFSLLDLPSSRYDANQVLALLEVEAVQRRFGIRPADLATLHRWVRDTGIRWGVDAAQRAALGLPAQAEHSWRFGLDRLLLGQMLGAAPALYQGILPYADPLDEEAALLGCFVRFTDTVFALRDTLGGTAPLPVWCERLQQVLVRLFRPVTADDTRQLHWLRTTLSEIAASVPATTPAQPLSVLKTRLREQLDRPLPAVAGHGVLFCPLGLARHLPFAVVCLIGMNHGDYPRRDQRPGFELPAAGVETVRAADRAQFLDAVLAARRCLYISYTGNDIRDNGAIPPSALVSELLETISRGYAAPEQVLIRQPLAAFSPRYFAQGRLFSYSQEMAEASRIAGHGTAQATPLFTQGLPTPEPLWRTVELGQLVQFYAHPVRYLLRQRLGLKLEERQALLDTREPFAPTAASVQRLREELLRLHRSGLSLDEAGAVLRAAGQLPHAQVGASVLAQCQADVAHFADRLDAVWPRYPLHPLRLDVTLGGIRLVGWLSDVGQDGLVRYRPGDVRPRDYLELWLYHLALCHLAPPGVSTISRWLGRDQNLLLQPVTQALPYLQTLLACYWQGLQRPLRFFPDSAFTYIEQSRNAESRIPPLAAARRRFRGNDAGQHGEADDLYYRLTFRDDDPLDHEFVELAETLVGPIFEHLEER